MTQIQAIRLATMELESPDTSRLADYYEQVVGLTLAEKGEKGQYFFSIGVDHHNVKITPSNRSRMRSMGFELDGTLDLSEVQKLLKNEGISSELKTDALPGIPSCLELTDPSENIVYLFNEMEQPVPGFSSTGINPLKLGHIAFGSTQQEKTVEFYELIGFVKTDYMFNRVATFLTCNRDHHVLNVMKHSNNQMHHVAFQLRDAGHQYQSSDFLARKNIPILYGPTRHTAGHNIATYHLDVDQNCIELYTDMDIFIKEKGIFEPRPWHEELPLRPRDWDSGESWLTEFGYSLIKVFDLKN
jgi:catechol-2,3-dioxygenase